MMEVGPLRKEDRARWGELWRAYLDFYRTQLPADVYDYTWSRLLAGTELHGYAARLDGRVVGITHFLFHPSCWTRKPVCYLQDLFTDPAHRGQGAGRTLIAAVAERARAAGSPRLYWLTQEGNAGARALYDKVAKFNGFIRYEQALQSDPD